MTRFTVVWDKEVEVPFTRVWVAGDPDMCGILSGIANWLDINLAIDPDRKGQLRPDLSARTIDVPLSIPHARVSATYEVIVNDRLVRVVRLVFRRD